MQILNLVAFLFKVLTFRLSQAAERFPTFKGEFKTKKRLLKVVYFSRELFLTAFLFEIVFSFCCFLNYFFTRIKIKIANSNYCWSGNAIIF